MGKLLNEDTLATFHDSLDRALERPDFFDRFYAHFLATPDIAAKFAGMDLARVKHLVRDSSSASGRYMKRKAAPG